MAIVLIEQRLSPERRKYIMDSEADVADLPDAPPGSTAVVAGGNTYIVNASGAWVAHGRASASAAWSISDDGEGNVEIGG